MAQRLSLLSLLVVLAVAPLDAQSPPATVEQVSNYKDWGWDALVMENGLVTLATVPQIGARVMQHDLGTHESIYINEDLLGRIDVGCYVKHYTDITRLKTGNFKGTRLLIAFKRRDTDLLANLHLRGLVIQHHDPRVGNHTCIRTCLEHL